MLFKKLIVIHEIKYNINLHINSQTVKKGAAHAKKVEWKTQIPLKCCYYSAAV